ncbi:MAG: hypothetical protein IKW39_00680 [Alphaproteobacteria bacterium]|nr:hypothetical protein [Alphaproteobacteria bacterium]
MSLKPAKVQFNGGELSPWLEARTDISKFDKTAKLCRNFIPLAEGSLKRRGGTKFISLTPEDEEITFSINTTPLEAEVIINGIATKEIVVARGEWVSYEVKATGYVSKVGKVYVNENKNINVELVSTVEMCMLRINAYPLDAVVKIGGYLRNTARFYKNSEVFYTVSCDGYITVSKKVVLSEDLYFQINLEKQSDVYLDDVYGDWGKPVAFISCTAAGIWKKRKKCILLRFEKGYLPIIFESKKIAPDADDIDESLFIYNQEDGADSVCVLDDVCHLCYLVRTNIAIYYYDLSGTLLIAFDNLSLQVLGWQLDEKGKYATYYNTYDGYVSGKTIKVYYEGDLVFVMDRRL